MARESNMNAKNSTVNVEFTDATAANVSDAVHDLGARLPFDPRWPWNPDGTEVLFSGSFAARRVAVVAKGTTQQPSAPEIPVPVQATPAEYESARQAENAERAAATNPDPVSVRDPVSRDIPF